MPFDTFLINIFGAFAIGIIYVLGVEKSHISQDLRIGIMVGFLGGFTTFSSYCLDGVKLLENLKYFQAIIYLCLSPILGVLATFLGIMLTRKFY